CGLGQLRDRRRALELGAHVLDQAGEHLVQLLEPTWHVHGPGAVAEVALDLADDGRDGIRPEEDAALQVEAVDRLDQADRRDLDEVVELLAAAGVAARDRAREGEIGLEELAARRRVPALVVRGEKLGPLQLVRAEAHADPLPAGILMSRRSQQPSSRIVDSLPATSVESRRSSSSRSGWRS